jgi:hypothetical protein
VSLISRYPDLTPGELRTLVTATSQVLLELGESDDPVPADLLEMSSGAVARMITTDLDTGVDADYVLRAVRDDASARAVMDRLVEFIRQYPELGAVIDEECQELAQKMFVPELLTGALVILALRIKRVKIGDIDIRFYRAGEEVKAFVSGLVKGIAD